MKKLLISLALFAALAVAGYASAATITIIPSATSVTVGQTVSVVVSVNAAGASISTVKADISYSQTLLQPTSFTFDSASPSWVPLSEAGYDSMGGGDVIKTAGLPGGFTGTKELGTITFTANAVGTATLAVSDKSLLYDSQNHNQLSGTQGSATITVIAPASSLGVQPTVTKTTQPKSTTTAPKPKPKPKMTTTLSTSATSASQSAATTTVLAVSTTSTSSANQAANTGTAQVAAAGASNSLPWVWIIIALLALGGLIWWMRRSKKLR